MDTTVAEDPRALREQLAQAREALNDLSRDLREVDGELEDLTEERQQYGLLEAACGALAELGALGAAGLFWDARTIVGDGEEHLELLRERVDVFAKRVHGIEDRRRKLLEELEVREDNVELLEDELYDSKLREEERKHEWAIERDAGPPPARPSVMAWTRSGEDDARFRKSLAASLLLSLLVGFLLPMIDLPLPESWEVTEVPDRLTRLIRDLPPPPPPVQETRKPAEAKPDPDAPVLATETVPHQAPEEPKASRGILAFREKFSDLAATRTPVRLGSEARITSSGDMEVGRPTRNMVATQASGSSGGINLASLSREVGGGGGQPAGVETARMTSSIGGAVGEDRPRSGEVAPGRTDEEIQIVFDRYKAALYRLYNRELRKDPTLKGQMVLRITIEPDGTVSLCELHASDMDAPGLSAQILDRVRTFDFGAKEVPPVTILYPIDFLPAT